MMSKLQNILEKHDKSLDLLTKYFVEKGEQLQQENTLLRKEILRMESIIRGLISVIADKELK